MNTIKDAFNAVVDAIILDNALSRADAGDIVNTFGPTLSNAQSRGWLDVIAQEYNSLGINNNNTYANLRNGIVNDGDIASKNLFDALAVRIGSLPESEVVTIAIVFEAATQAQAAIAANIVIVGGFKTAGANQQLDDSLDQAISFLNNLDLNLRNQLGI